MLNTNERSNQPAVIGDNGSINFNISFEYGNGAEVYHSCGVVFESEFYILGGVSSVAKNQISKVGKLS